MHLRERRYRKIFCIVRPMLVFAPIVCASLDPLSSCHLRSHSLDLDQLRSRTHWYQDLLRSCSPIFAIWVIGPGQLRSCTLIMALNIKKMNFCDKPYYLICSTWKNHRNRRKYIQHMSCLFDFHFLSSTGLHFLFDTFQRNKLTDIPFSSHY